MSGDQFKPIEAPYLKQWQDRMTAKPIKPVVKKRKGKRKVRAK